MSRANPSRILVALGLVAACSSTPSTQSPSAAIDAGGNDASADAGTPPSGEPSLTYDALASAYAALRNGSDDVAVSTEGRERLRRTKATNGDETDELSIDGRVVFRAQLTGSLSHFEQDTNRDGVFDSTLDVTRNATPTDRELVIESDPSAVGNPTGRTMLTQTLADTVHVKEEAFHGGSWVTVREGDEPVLQGADALVDTTGCPDDVAAAAEATVKQAVDQGLAQMQKYRVDDIVNGLTALIALEGIHVACDSTLVPLNLCGEASILDTLTQGRAHGFITIQVSPSAACFKPVTIFHELLHSVLGRSHWPPQRVKDPEWKAEDRIYSCQDVAFEADNVSAPTTKCECATCLQTDPDNTRCATFASCPADIVFYTATCVAKETCQCGIYAGNVLYIDATGRMKGQRGAIGVVPNPTADPAQAKLDCGAWTSTPGDAVGAGVACVRDPSDDSIAEWHVTSKIACDCAGGSSYPAIATLFSKSLGHGGQLLAMDQTMVTCP